jgi:hypothetical protein
MSRKGRKHVCLTRVQRYRERRQVRKIKVKVEKWLAGADRAFHGRRTEERSLNGEQDKAKALGRAEGQGDRLVGITST